MICKGDEIFLCVKKVIFLNSKILKPDEVCAKNKTKGNFLHKYFCDMLKYYQTESKSTFKKCALYGGEYILEM